MKNSFDPVKALCQAAARGLPAGAITPEQMRQRWVRELQIALMARDWNIVQLLLYEMQHANFEAAA